MKRTRPPLKRTKVVATAEMIRGVSRVLSVYNGNQTDMAKALGVRQPTVCNWLKGERRVSPALAVHMESCTRALGRTVLRAAIRPDLFGQG